MCPLRLVYGELSSPVITFSPPCVVWSAGLKAHSGDAAVCSDTMPVSGPISFDKSPHAKNYSLQQSTLVLK